MSRTHLTRRAARRAFVVSILAAHAASAQPQGDRPAPPPPPPAAPEGGPKPPPDAPKADGPAEAPSAPPKALQEAPDAPKAPPSSPAAAPNAPDTPPEGSGEPDTGPEPRDEDEPYPDEDEPYEIEVNAGAGASSQTAGAPAPAGANDRVPDDDREDAMEITVVGVRMARAPGSAHVIRKGTLERTEYDDPASVLMSVPGVHVRSEDGFGLRPNIAMRGVQPDRSKKITLMEDGVLLKPAPYSAPAAYYFPLVTRFTQMRVIKGPSAIQYGPQTVGGAIDFVTRPIPTTDSGEIDVGIGQFGYHKVHAWTGTSTDHLGVLIEGAHLDTTGFKQLPQGGDTGYYRNEVVLKGSYVPNPTSSTPSEFRLKLMYSDELSNESYLGLTDADFRANPLQRYGPSRLDQMKWHRTGFSLSHHIAPAKNFEILTTVYRNDLSRTWRKVNQFSGANLFDVLTKPDVPSNRIYVSILRGDASTTALEQQLYIGPNERDFVSEGVQTRANYKTHTGPLIHSIEYGLRLHYDRIQRHHTQDAYNVVAGDVSLAGAPTQTTALNEGWTEAMAFHVVDAVTWDALTVTPGVRVELMRSAFVDFENSTETRGAANVVLPGAGAFYGLTEDFGVLAGLYRGFSPPPPGAPESQKPELSVNYEAGARYTKGRARAELIGYYTDYSNLTDVCEGTSVCVGSNTDVQFQAGRARIYGLESFVGHDVSLGEDLTMPLSASYTLSLAEFRSDFVSGDPVFPSARTGDPIPYIPKHQINGLVGLEHETAGGYVTGNYIAPMLERADSTDPQKLYTDAQTTLGLGAYYRPLEWLRLYANVRNVFDSIYLVGRRPFGARPNAPRWVQVGLKASF